jgi:hypothetical protein
MLDLSHDTPLEPEASFEALLDRLGKRVRVAFDAIDDPDRWNTLLARADRAHSVQAFGYGAAKAENGWSVTRQVLSIDGRPVALVQALEKRVMGLRLVTRINRGPMFLMPEPPAELVIAVYRAIRRRWGLMGLGLLLIAPALEDTPSSRDILRAAGFFARKGSGWGSARLDLTQPIEQVFDGFEHRWRKAIRAADKAGVTVRVSDDPADFEWMVARHLDNMSDKGFSGHGADFLNSLKARSGTDCVLLIAEHEGEKVAGLVMLKFGATADSIVAWFGDAGRQVKAGNAITWGAIREMQRLGCVSYDVGGIVADKGFVTFKTGMNGKEYFLAGEFVGL